MTADQLRNTYLDFFAENSHAIISGRSLVPENDPTVLFTTAGMHPLVPYLLGQPHPAGVRLANCQKCIRTGDIEQVGDNSHLTFFEMLGNWSLGDYFKSEAIRFSYEFLTRRLDIAPERLSVTVFAGDDVIESDEEAARIWRANGIPEARIHYLPRSDNWWGPAGSVGPCGPDTEMFIDTGSPPAADSRPGRDDAKYIEVWNDVFMQYHKQADGSYARLKRRCVDTGMGLERMIAILQGKRSVYETELFVPLIEEIEQLSAVRYGDNADTDRSIRIICDHIKAATFILGDEQWVAPSNLGRGYVLRRLIRRAQRHGHKLRLERTFLRKPAQVVIDMYAGVYPQLRANAGRLLNELNAEEERFLVTLRRGENEFEKLLHKMDAGGAISGRAAFRLYDTFGFPFELTTELAAEHGLSVDRAAFDSAFDEHRQASKQDGAFRGGLAEHTAMTTRLHTATHLLHQALRDVLGEHITQRGSNITAERLRFDFSHPNKMSADERARVEEIVNRQIKRNLPVGHATMKLEEARAYGAIALFGDKYDEVVTVYSIGDYSTEVCGGPHVKNTAELGQFRIVKEQSSSHGVRRIRAALE